MKEFSKDPTSAVGSTNHKSIKEQMSVTRQTLIKHNERMMFLIECFLCFDSPSAVCYRRISNQRISPPPHSGEKTPAARWPPPLSFSGGLKALYCLRGKQHCKN